MPPKLVDDPIRGEKRKDKKKPVRRDPEKRRQQNIRAQRKYREKKRERMEALESLAASVAQKSPTLDIIQAGSFPDYNGSDMSITCSSTATPREPQEWQPIHSQTAHATSTLDLWESAIWDCTAEPSPSALVIADHAKQLPPPEPTLDSLNEWIPPTYIDPSMLFHDKTDPDQCSTTTTVKCDCASPHFQVETSSPGPFGTIEVRVIRVGPLAPAPDPYANHLRLETICTLAAMDSLRLHVGLTEEMVCAEEHPSPFYRAIRAPANSTAAENMVCTVQRIFKTLKPDLRPSSEQITIEHPPYIDILPFQTVRKNLILRQHEIDEDEFLLDMVSGLVCWGGAGLGKRDRDASTGYASTGTPWDNRSWEAKAWFLKKYWSLLGGEEGELVRQSEWWRNIRGEEPLEIEELV